MVIKNHPANLIESYPGVDKLPAISLESWILLGPDYGAYHQIHRMAFYMHPYRFVRRVVDSWNIHKLTCFDIEALKTAEELEASLKGFGKQLGLARPCSSPGSTLPEIIQNPPSHHVSRLTATQRTLQPDWQSCYFPTMPLRKATRPGRGRAAPPLTTGFRYMWMPESFIPYSLSHLVRPGDRVSQPPQSGDPNDLSQAVVMGEGAGDMIRLFEDHMPRFHRQGYRPRGSMTWIPTLDPLEKSSSFPRLATPVQRSSTFLHPIPNR